MTGTYEAFLESYRHDGSPTLRIVCKDECGEWRPFSAWHVTNAWTVVGLLSTIKSLCPDLRQGKNRMNLRCREIECDHCHGGM